MERKPQREKVLWIHSAGSATEAMVIRGLLESAGIASPGSDTTDPFPMNEPREGARAADVLVRESQAAKARRIIAEYLRGSESLDSEDSNNPSDDPPSP